MPVKVILTQDVKALGKKGDVVEVADGYARNYLLPRGLAVPATAGALKELENQKRQEIQKRQQELIKAQAVKDKLAGQTVRIMAKAGEGGKLFGAVTAKEIADHISRQLGLAVDKRRIDLREPIKSLGAYPVAIKLHPDLTAVTITVEVKAETK